MNKDRRKFENTAMRDLVEALKKNIDARDALWSLGFFDRLFRRDKCRAVFNEYDVALLAVRDAVRGVINETVCRGEATGKRTRSAPVETGPLLPLPPSVTVEEFEVLLGKPVSSRKL